MSNAIAFIIDSYFEEYVQFITGAARKKGYNVVILSRYEDQAVFLAEHYNLPIVYFSFANSQKFDEIVKSDKNLTAIQL
jgi:hypothetical protein